MTSIGAAAYQHVLDLLTKNSSMAQQTLPSQNASNQDAAPDAAAPASGGDQVTLSPAVDEARLRETLGLPPTGKITRQDFIDQIQADQAGVRQTLQDNLQKLGLAADTPVTLSRDARGQMQVSGAGSNNAALTKSLNADADFTKMFARLAANSKFLSFPTQSAAASLTANLSTYLDNESAANANLATLLQQYSSLKNPSTSFAGLISLSSKSGNPFTFSNNSD